MTPLPVETAGLYEALAADGIEAKVLSTPRISPAPVEAVVGAAADFGSAVGNQVSGSGADGITVEAGSSGTVISGNVITSQSNSFSSDNAGAGIRLLGSAEARHEVAAPRPSQD